MVLEIGFDTTFTRLLACGQAANAVAARSIASLSAGLADGSVCPTYTTRPENLCSLRRFVGRTPWSAADAPVGPVLVAARLLCGAGNPARSRLFRRLFWCARAG